MPEYETVYGEDRSTVMNDKQGMSAAVIPVVENLCPLIHADKVEQAINEQARAQ